MSKAENAVQNFELYQCAQSVLAAYAGDFSLDKEKALSVAAGFGAGIGRLQETCGAVSGAIMALGLSSNFKESDRRDKINGVYAKARRFTDEFSAKMGTIKCRELIDCDLSTEEGQKIFREQNRKEKCRDCVRLSCEILDRFLAEMS